MYIEEHKKIKLYIDGHCNIKTIIKNYGREGKMSNESTFVMDKRALAVPKTMLVACQDGVDGTSRQR